MDLLNLLKTLPCRVILSGYPSALYDDTLEDRNRVELQAMTWGGPRTEKIWYNAAHTCPSQILVRSEIRAVTDLADFPKKSCGQVFD